jgi:hypothetical protein
MSVAPTPLPSEPAEHQGVPWLVLGIVALFAVAATTVVLLAHFDAFGGSSTVTPVQGSGVAASQTRDIAPFDALSLTGANDVVVRVGSPQSVVVRADAELLDRVTTRVQDGRLLIGTKPGSLTSRTGMRVDVTVPSLRYLTLDGSGVIAVSGVDTAGLAVFLSGNGVIRARGRASRLVVRLDGVGDVQLGSLVAEYAYAVLGGSGRIAVTALRSLDASLPGVGAIVYGGGPDHVTRSITGQGTITSR